MQRRGAERSGVPGKGAQGRGAGAPSGGSSYPRGAAGYGPGRAPEHGTGGGTAPGAPAGERLAIFGGSFDPVHAGHLLAAEAARRAFGLDRVLLVPAARSPHKAEGPLAPGEDRARLLEVAAAGRPHLAVSRLELERGGPSYTIDTARALAARHRPSALYLVLGADNLPGLPTWRGVAELLDLARPIVVPRGGDPRALLRDLEGQLAPRHLAALGEGLLPVAPLQVSATELRARLARGEDPGPALPPGVLDAIRARGLYGWPTRAR